MKKNIDDLLTEARWKMNVLKEMANGMLIAESKRPSTLQFEDGEDFYSGLRMICGEIIENIKEAQDLFEKEG